MKEESKHSYEKSYGGGKAQGRTSGDGADSYTIHTYNFNEKAELLGMECRNCGGVLELVDRTHAVCPYCGQKYLIDEAKGTVINIQVDYSGNEEMRQEVNRTRTMLIWFLVVAGLLALIIFGFNIAARKSVFSTSDEDIPVDANGELLVIFCQDIFGKEFDKITKEELESIRYLRCSYEREGNDTYNVISYSFTDYQDCEDDREFQRTVETWTYRTKMVSWPSDYSMFTGLTRLDTTNSVWLSLLHFAPDNQISYVDTEDSLEVVAQVLNPEAIKVLHIGIMGVSLEGVGQFPNLEELVVETTLARDSVDLSGIEECRNLKKLRLQCGEGYTGLEKLKELPGLTSLYMDHTPLGECGVLKELPGLTELWIYTGEEPDLTPLESLTSLKRVYFVDREYIPAEEVRILQGIGGLEELMIAANDMEALGEIAKLESLKELDLHLAVFEYQVPTDLSALRALTNLERLQVDNFWGNEISGVEPLLNLPGLKTFRLGRVSSSQVELILDTTALQDNPMIEELGFTTCSPVDPETGEEMGYEFLRHYPGVKWLYLDDCGVTDVSFAEVMSDLRGCSLKRDDIGDVTPLFGCKKLDVVCVDEAVTYGVEFPPEMRVYTKVYESIYGYSIFE